MRAMLPPDRYTTDPTATATKMFLTSGSKFDHSLPIALP
ncbi:unnamed protein product, partial [marine sediment metagenome]